MIFTNVIYVDPSQSTNGDGLTPSTALNKLPDFTDMVNDTQYIIRRGTTTQLNGTIDQFSWDVGSITGKGVNNTIHKLGLIGAPKSTDFMSKLVPNIIYTVWGEDDDKDDPIITADINNMYISSSLYDFEMRNIQLVKLDNNSDWNKSERYEYSSCSAVFNFAHGNTPLSGTNYYGSYSFVNCKFDGDLDKTAVVENSTSFVEGIATDYINLGESSIVSNVTIKNCYIKHAPTVENADFGYSGSAFSIGFVSNHCEIINNEIHSVTVGSGDYYIPSYRHSVFVYYGSNNNIYGEKTLNFSNNNYYIHRKQNGKCYPGLFDCQQRRHDFGTPWLNVISKNIKISDISGGILGEITHISLPDTLKITNNMLNYGSTYNCDISNINVELSDCKYIYHDGVVIRCLCPTQQYSFSQDNTFISRMMSKNISNVIVKLADKDQGVCAESITYRGSASNESNYLYSWDTPMTCLLTSGVVLNNINVINYYGKGITINGCSLLGTNNISGILHIRDSKGYLNNIKTDLPYGIIKYWGNGSTIQIENIEFNNEQTKYDNNRNTIEFENQYTFYNTTTQIKSINTLCHSLNPWYTYNSDRRSDSKSSGGCITVLNDDGKSGRFNLYSSYGNVTTWSAGRSGGSTNVLKITNTLRSVQDHITIGKYPSNIIFSNVEQDGNYKVKLYFAHTGYSPINNEVLNFTIYSEDKQQYWTSTTCGGIENDNSEWSGTGDDTEAKCITIILDNVKAGNIYGRIDFRGYDPAGAIYIDPVIEITKIDITE